jgi:hypothetical protein
MKASLKPCFISIAALLFCAPAQAQMLSALGVKAGINSSTSEIVMSGVDELRLALETQRRVGWQAAAFAEWLRLPVVSIVTQVEYAQRGFTEEQVRTNDPIRGRALCNCGSSL